MKETLKVFTVNCRLVGQRHLANLGVSQSRKPLGSKTEVRTLARLRERLSMPRVMRGEVRVKGEDG
jgi:hypothetical protein